MRQPYGYIRKNMLGQFPEDDMNYPALRAWQMGRAPIDNTNNRGVLPAPGRSVAPLPSARVAARSGSNQELQRLPSIARNPGRFPASAPSDLNMEEMPERVSEPLGIDGLRVLHWKGSDPQIREQIRTAKPGKYAYTIEDGRVTAFAPFSEENSEEWIGGREAGNRVQQASLIRPITDITLRRMGKWASKKLGGKLLDAVQEATSLMSQEKVAIEIVDKEIAGLDPQKDWEKIDDLQKLKRHIEKDGFPDWLDALGMSSVDVFSRLFRKKDETAPSQSSEPTAGEPSYSDRPSQSDGGRPKTK